MEAQSPEHFKDLNFSWMDSTPGGSEASPAPKNPWKNGAGVSEGNVQARYL